MLAMPQNLCARSYDWWIRRNPTYLVSAAVMAFATRLYLVRPHARAGDLGLILLTFAILAAYEWSVLSILLTLHHKRRSLEDIPSLLLVAGLFWTGPLVATAEMIGRRADLGTFCALGSCVIALIQLRIIRRRLKLAIASDILFLAKAGVVFLAVVPLFLHHPSAESGMHELILYAAWWAFTAIILASLLIPSRRSSHVPAHPWRAGRVETSLMLIVLTAVAAQLYGMNYAFFCHARLFYAAPFIAVMAAMGFRYIARDSHPASIAAVACLPAIALALTVQSFDQQVPLEHLPRLLRDVRTPVLALSALVWWYGYARHRAIPLLHAANAVFAYAAVRIINLYSASGTESMVPTVATHMTRDTVVIALYAVAGYLVLIASLRRSRPEAIVAVVIHQIALTLLVVNRCVGDVQLIGISAGWSWLLAVHLTGRCPTILLRSYPLMLLLAVTWLTDFNPQLQWLARAHAVSMVLILLLVGQLVPGMRFRAIALGTMAADTVFYGGRWIAAGQDPSASVAALCGFLLLIAGAGISWFKPRLVLPEQTPEPEPAEETPAFADGAG